MAAKGKAGKAGALILVLLLESSRVVGAWALGVGIVDWNPVVGILESHCGPFRATYQNN